MGAESDAPPAPPAPPTPPTPPTPPPCPSQSPNPKTPSEPVPAPALAPAPAPNNPRPPPTGPLCAPLLPSSDLTLTPLVPHQIYLIRNFLPASLCKTYAAFLSSLPLTTTPGRPKKDEAVRVNDRFQVDDARFAETLWSTTALRELVTERFDGDHDDEYEHEHEPKPETETGDGDAHVHNRLAQTRALWGGIPLGLNPNIRIYRYTEGQFFGQHYDESNALTFLPAGATRAAPARTTWTLLVYLTTCAGGETVFYPEATRAEPRPAALAVAPEVGMALLHRHGDACMLHEGREVTGGEKWVLRSDLVVAR
ncbi:hypothetical protein N7462_006519 [Penicillium macrosclerotiorum]|uniref:uncharacterized protein n=1 Tax=Penicillium macrosclerotiorum TaxID=303699 RepID=UPI002547CB5B|nr:uncharacterized protein N7462_006519 [Penicillium macrosclerotiorum]KAJ5683354.1 hypothetical protein N7462_006519 [Penicillium macrosclerotiorum]